MFFIPHISLFLWEHHEPQQSGKKTFYDSLTASSISNVSPFPYTSVPLQYH
jgi:hypothetical protein